MPAVVGADEASTLCARLQIHADGIDRADAGGVFAQWMARFRALNPFGTRSPSSHGAGVRVRDVHGREHLVLDSLRSTVDIELPAGTYHVSVRLGSWRRLYTVTLESGRTFDLHVRLPAAPQ